MSKTIRLGNESFPIACLGMSFIFAWMTSSFFTSNQSPIASYGFIDVWIPFQAGAFISFFFFVLSEKKLGELSLNSHVQLAAIFFVAFGTLLMSVGSEISTIQILITSSVGAAAAGFGMVPLFIAWGYVFLRISTAQAEVVIPVNIVIAMVLSVLLSLITAWWVTVITVLLSILSFIFLRLAFKEIGEIKPARKTEANAVTWKIPWKIPLLLIVFWAAFDISRSYALAVGTTASPQAFLLISIMGVAIATVVTFVFLFFSNKVSFFSILQIVLPLSCASLLLTPLVPERFLTLAFVIGFIASINLDVYIWILASSLARKGRFSCTRIVGGSRLAVQGGGLIGVIIVSLVPAELKALVISILIIILIIVVMLAAPELEAFEGREKKAAAEEFSPEVSVKDELALRCEQLGVRFNLSQREIEVLQLLSKGRDAPYIRDTLYISRNTVNTHVKSIYRKLGIHSKQELLNRTEAPME